MLVEFADDATEILLANDQGEFSVLHIQDLLPGAFDPADLPGHG